MTSRLTTVLYIALACLILSLGLHTTGLLTDYWCVGTRESSANSTESQAIKLNIGLVKQVFEFGNGTVVESESWLQMKEEQWVIVAISIINVVLCFILYVKAVSIVVGISSFVMMTLMLLSVINTFERTDGRIRTIQNNHPNLPKLALGWSFGLVFTGLFLNTISSAIILSIILTKGKREVSRSLKGLPPRIKAKSIKRFSKKVPSISVITTYQPFENIAYSNDDIVAYNNELRADLEASASGFDDQSHTGDSTMYSLDDIAIAAGEKFEDYEILHDDDKGGDVYEKLHLEFKVIV